MRHSKRSAVVTLLCVVIASLLCAAEEHLVTIATWNVENLGSKTVTESRAEVLRAFDIAALQEVESEDGLKHLQSSLIAASGAAWEYVISPSVGEGNAAEHYAFIYRADRVEYVIDSAGVYPEAATDEFSREPFYATFRAGDFDFTLVTVHVTWGSLASLRTAECRRLSSVWTYVQDLDPYENDLILLGDFNRDRPTHSAFDELTALGVTPILTTAGTRTTFGRTATGGSWYDNMWVDLLFSGQDYTGSSGAGAPEHDTSGSRCSAGIEEASDHCPVWAQFYIERGDDDPVQQPH